MGTLIIPCKSTRSAPLPSDFCPKPIKASFSVSKTHQLSPSKSPDFAHLCHLLRIGNFGEVLTALDSIGQNGRKLRPDTYTQLLDCCIDLGSVELGRELHARIHLVDNVNPFVKTKLVSMYAKCGSLNDARKMFDEMSKRNLFTWSAMIGAYSREHRWGEVVCLFGGMMQDGILPDKFLFPRILQACAHCGDYETGKLMHSLVVRSGMSSCRRVSNALMAVYAKCGKTSLARRLFDEMCDKDRVTWNSLIYGYCQRGKNDEARRLFDMMSEEGIEPGLITWNILIAGYNQSGDCKAAMELMNKMGSFGVTPDVFTWTSMISGHTQNDLLDEALKLFRDMLQVGVHPNGVTLASAVSACASKKSLSVGKQLHSLAVKVGLSDDVLLGNALIDMYSKCGELEAARKVFELMAEKDVYTWNSMIGGYCQGGYYGKAHDLFMRIQKSDVQPNVVTWNIMISGFIQNGDEDQAMDLFQMMGKNGIVKPDTSSWNSLIASFLQIGEKDKALRIFRQMQSFSFQPNPVTILTVLPACANLIAANKVKEIHACVLHRGLNSHIAISNSLIDTYAKSGNIVYSKCVFDGMLQKDIITWNTMIAGYVLHGLSNDALDAFDQMKKEEFKPNRGTFVSLIHAYSQAKMVTKGQQVFYSMTNEYQIMPRSEHYAAMVDLFGRSGRLKEAFDFIGCVGIESDLGVWEALLTASRHFGNIDLMIHAGERVLKLNPGNTTVNSLVSQAYNFYNRTVDALKERHSSGNKDNKKDLGCSLIELNNKVYSFVSGDQSIPGFERLYTWLRNVTGSIKLPNSNSMPCIDEEDEEEILGLHSEKLALAFAFVSTRCKVKRIRIVKNFRICNESHQTAKYISSAYGCEILLSDTKCLHHIKNGCCSCGDYW